MQLSKHPALQTILSLSSRRRRLQFVAVQTERLNVLKKMRLAKTGEFLHGFDVIKLRCRRLHRPSAPTATPAVTSQCRPLHVHTAQTRTFVKRKFRFQLLVRRINRNARFVNQRRVHVLAKRRVLERATPVLATHADAALDVISFHAMPRRHVVLRTNRLDQHPMHVVIQSVSHATEIVAILK